MIRGINNFSERRGGEGRGGEGRGGEGRGGREGRGGEGKGGEGGEGREGRGGEEGGEGGQGRREARGGGRGGRPGEGSLTTVATLDVEEFLHSNVRSETCFRDNKPLPANELESNEVSENRGVAMSDVCKGTGMNKHWGSL